jgi:Spy/CpxP family protein refolding chaperone
MINKLRLGVAVFLLAVIAAAPVMAHREMRAGYGSGPGNVEDITETGDLGLTAEQKEKIRTLREVHLRDIRPLQERLYVKSRELKELWLSKTPGREGILAFQREVQALRNQLMEKITTHLLDVRQILTPEQQAKIRSYGPGHRMWRMGGPGMRGDDENGRGMRKPRPSGAGAAP